MTLAQTLALFAGVAILVWLVWIFVRFGSEPDIPSEGPAKSQADLIHDVAVSVLEEIGQAITPILPQGWKFCLWIRPTGDDELRYWSGTVTEKEFQDMLLIRLAKYADDEMVVKQLAKIKGIK